MQQALLAVDDLSVRIDGLQILKGINLRVPRGSVYGLIGPNGAGKTTVFNVICGFVTPQTGVMRFNATRLRGHRPHHLARLGIARTLQGVGLFPDLTAVENVMMGAPTRTGIVADALAMPWADRREAQVRARAYESLRELGVEDAAERYPGELPYPMQKRVALARALIADPQLIMLDEPAGGIGASDIAELATLIRSWTPQRTVLLVEHHMDLVMNVCERITVLDAGRVIAVGTPDQVRSNPAVLAAYLGEEAGV